MQNRFSYRFSENIWRILPDSETDNNLWVIELRGTIEKTISFAVLDVVKQELIWQGQPEAADWWTSLTTFSNATIYLHNYRNPEIPEPTDLLAVSARSGELKWVLPNHILVTVIDRDTLQVAAKQGDHFVKKNCDAETGELSVLSENEPGNDAEIILREPVRYKTGDEYFEKLRRFIQDKTDGHVAISIDYLERRPYVIFSYYIYEQDKTVQYLLIVTDQNQLILHEKLSEGRDGMGRSTMILKASTLVYLKNNNEFSSLTLS